MTFGNHQCLGLGDQSGGAPFPNPTSILLPSSSTRHGVALLSIGQYSYSLLDHTGGFHHQPGGYGHTPHFCDSFKVAFSEPICILPPIPVEPRDGRRLPHFLFDSHFLSFPCVTNTPTATNLVATLPAATSNTFIRYLNATQ